MRISPALAGITWLASTSLGLLSCEIQAQQRNITVQNLSPFSRQEWVSTVVPFAKGEVHGQPDLHIGKGATIWQPIGSRWNDGSLRQAICLFPIHMSRLSEARLPLEKGPGKPLPADQKIQNPLMDESVKVTLEITTEKGVTISSPKFVRELESNPARTVSLYRCRAGQSGLVFELILTTYLGQQHSKVSLGLFFSDPTTKALHIPIKYAVVKTRGMHLVVRHTQQLGIQHSNVDGGSRVQLLQNAVLGDGQGIRRVGVLAPMPTNYQDLAGQTIQAAALSPILASTPWTNTKAYGPFGHVPEPPPWMQGNQLRATLARRHAQFVHSASLTGDPFKRFEFQLAKNPSQTGKQDDFGILKLSAVASTGLPSFLLEVERAVLQEACRPVHFFESDGSPLQVANHPKLVLWTGRPHWNCDVSTDRLGKECPQPKYPTNGWRAKDRQHWSSNYLCGYYLLTGSAWARREIDNEVQLFLGSQTVRDGLATTGSGAPRAAGRMLMLGCWLYQCTGNEALLTRMRERMHKSYLPCWDGRDFKTDKVRPMAIKKPDGRMLKGKAAYWNPWQESMAAVGFFALYKTTGDTTAKMMADTIATTTLRHGWLVNRSDARVGYAMKWNPDGSPLTEQQKITSDPLVCKWAGGGITAWSVGAVEVARHFALARQDKSLTLKADTILQRLRANSNRPPKSRWWDDFREWDAVR